MGFLRVQSAQLGARVAKLVYALDLGSSGATRESSSLSSRTILFLLIVMGISAWPRRHP